MIKGDGEDDQTAKEDVTPMKEAELHAIEWRWTAPTAPQHVTDPVSGETLSAPADVLALIADYGPASRR